MASREFVKARLAMTRHDLNQVLAHLTDADLRWVPGEGMKTVGDLLLEVANKDREIVGWLRKSEWPDDEPDPFSGETSTLEEMKAGLQSTRADTLAYLESIDDAQLEELLSLPEPWWEALRLLECPRSEMLRNASAHEWYHTGQLIVYLWMRGDNPYEWA